MMSEAAPTGRAVHLVNGSDIELHLPLLTQLAKECLVVVEFGVRHGESTKALIDGVLREVVSFDIADCSSDVLTQRAVRQGKEWKFRQVSSLDVSIPWCDMLFIDSKHTYEQLKAELEKHHSRVETYIVMHDTYLYGLQGEDGKAPGLMLAIDEFLEKYRDWHVVYECEDNNGLTVLRRM